MTPGAPWLLLSDDDIVPAVTDNVLITPHIGGDTTYFPRAAGALVCDQVARYLGKEPLLNVISGSY